jgi:chromosomal replication initiation ATPase DnaA
VTVWDEILAHLQTRLPGEDYRRTFDSTAYASDSGDQITVWVPSEAIRRHIQTHHTEDVREAVVAVGRTNTVVRFVVSGTSDDEEEIDE